MLTEKTEDTMTMGGVMDKQLSIPAIIHAIESYIVALEEGHERTKDWVKNDDAYTAAKISLRVLLKVINGEVSESDFSHYLCRKSNPGSDDVILNQFEILNELTHNIRRYPKILDPTA